MAKALLLTYLIIAISNVAIAEEQSPSVKDLVKTASKLKSTIDSSTSAPEDKSCEECEQKGKPSKSKPTVIRKKKEFSFL